MNLSQCCTQRFFGHNNTYIYWALEWNWEPSIMVGAYVKNIFKSLDYLDWFKKYGLRPKVFLQTLFWKICAQYLSDHTDSTIPIYLWVRCRKLQQPAYYDFSTLIFSNYIKHRYWETFGWNFSNWDAVNVQWMYLRSTSVSNITEKNLIWLAG